MQISEAAKKAACDLVPENQQKVCPYCGSSRIGIFDSDNDSCVDCKKWWSAGSHRVIVLRDSGELKRKELRIQQAIDEATSEKARDLDETLGELAESNALIHDTKWDALAAFISNEADELGPLWTIGKTTTDNFDEAWALLLSYLKSPEELSKKISEKDREIERMREDAEIGSFLRSEIKGLCESAGMDMSGTPPMMYPEAILVLIRKKITALELAIENAGLDVSPCRECGEPVVCVPDGLGTYCEKCAEKLGVQAAKDFMDELGKPF